MLGQLKLVINTNGFIEYVLPKTAFIRTIVFCPTPKTLQMTYGHFSHYMSTPNAHILSFFSLAGFIFGGIHFLPSFRGLYDKVHIIRYFIIYRLFPLLESGFGRSNICCPAFSHTIGLTVLAYDKE
jgi:hypothetical protein